VTDRRTVVAATAAAFSLAALPVRGQRPAGRAHRVAILGATTAAAYATRWNALRDGLRELGYVEGRDLLVEARWADGDVGRLPALAAELVQWRPDVLVTHGIPGTRAAAAASRTIPIVMAIVTDPVAAGLVASFPRPGGNVTGNAWFAPELSAKRVGLVRELDPRAASAGVLVNPANAAFTQAMLAPMEASAASIGVRLHVVGARSPVELPAAFATLARARVDALVVLEEAVLNSHPAAIASHAVELRLPAIGNREFAEHGGLVGYGVDLHELFHATAATVDRILRGAHPRDLPIQQATTFELLLNRRTAAAIDRRFPQSMIVRATRVID
jgi:putative ABC transport system substrate-binding protein